MDFGKAKSVLIVLFLFVNLFLIYHLFSLSDDSIRIDRTSIDDTITLLNQRGITIDRELIPTRLDHMDYLELSNPLIDADQFASTLVKSTQKNGDTYVGEGGSLIITDGTFYAPINTPSTSFKLSNYPSGTIEGGNFRNSSSNFSFSNQGSINGGIFSTAPDKSIKLGYILKCSGQLNIRCYLLRYSQYQLHLSDKNHCFFRFRCTISF